VLAAGEGHDVTVVVDAAMSPVWRTTGPSRGWDVVRRTTVPSRAWEVLVRTTGPSRGCDGDDATDVLAAAAVVSDALDVPVTRGRSSSERTASTATATVVTARPRPVS
jgi:hypothetical protein